MIYSTGSFRRTFNSLASSKENSNAVTFQQIISGYEWTRIVLSSYCTDFEWLLSQFVGVAPAVPIALIAHYDRNSESPGLNIMKAKPLPGSRDNQRNVLILSPHFPKFPNYGVMHCKLLILFSRDILRIAVSTANLVEYDYDQVQNMVFIQDLPRKTAGHSSSASSCQFHDALLGLLNSLGAFKYSEFAKESQFSEYNWEHLKASLVYSVPGYTDTINHQSTGMAMLNRVVAGASWFHPKDTASRLVVEYQGSSLGSYNKNWTDGMLAATRGQLGIKRPECLKRKTIDDGIIDLTGDGDELSLIFPRMQTVLNSTVGPGGFGTLFCRDDYFKTPGARKYLRDCINDPVLLKADFAMHSKIMTVSEEGKDGNSILYWYCGSHNPTASAWGKLVKSGAKIMIANYEVGVIFAPRDLESSEFPYPYVRPPPAYKEDDMPWCQNLFFN